MFPSTLCNWYLLDDEAYNLKGIHQNEGKNLSDLDFAYDIAVMTNNSQDLHLFMDISSHAGNIGLIIKAKKTKNMLSREHHIPTDIFNN